MADVGVPDHDEFAAPAVAGAGPAREVEHREHGGVVDRIGGQPASRDLLAHDLRDHVERRAAGTVGDRRIGDRRAGHLGIVPEAGAQAAEASGCAAFGCGGPDGAEPDASRRQSAV